MASAKEIRKFIESEFETEYLEDLGMHRMLLELADERSHIVLVAVNDEFFEVISPFANFDDVTPKRALEVASNRLLGIQVYGESYFVKHVVPVQDIDESEVITGIQMAAIVADTLEQDLGLGDNF